jgi:hypothetical protein
MTALSRSVKLKSSEFVFYSWFVYKARKHCVVPSKATSKDWARIDCALQSRLPLANILTILLEYHLILANRIIAQELISNPQAFLLNV